MWQVAGVIVGEPIKKENPPCTQYPIHDDEDDVPLDKNIICHFEFENKMVWGLTAYMTVEFLKLLDIEIDLTRK